MMLPNTAGQILRHNTYRLDGTITAGGTSQLVSPIPASRSSYLFHNASQYPMYLEFGSARATCTISNGQVNSVTITNGGFGFLLPPEISFQGGAPFSNQVGGGGLSGVGLPGYAAPSNWQNAGGRPAVAHCVLTSGVVTSIVIDDPGAGYAVAPFMAIRNAYGDGYGCADPDYGSVNSGQIIGPNGSNYVNGTVCPTDQISVWCATTGAPFMFMWTA